MAGTITHAYFAYDVYQKFDIKKKQKFKNYIDNIKTYGQGHDILFFSNKSYLRKRANYYHKKKTKLFFINIIDYIKENNLENNIDVISFLYGYICHYCLDYTVHPYITYKGGIFKPNNKETYKYNSKHSEIETYIDCYMISKRENIDNKLFKFYNFCLNYNKPSMELINLINHIFYKTYNDKNIAIYYFKALKQMKRLYKIMRYDSKGYKLKLYKFIDNLLPKNCRKLYPISYAQKLDNNEYYLNLKNNKWNHPRYKDEIYNYSFIDLYNKALEDALNIINAVDKVLYKNEDISYLDEYFLNLSFSSGKDCNNKTKNKYFEY